MIGTTKGAFKRDEGSYDLSHTYDVIILDVISTEEAIMAIGESLYSKYKLLDMV